MKHGIFSFLTVGAAALALTGASYAANEPELRVLTHSSFGVPKPLLAEFEKTAGVKLRIAKAGDAGEMLNKLILTRENPIADVVFGIDNTLAHKALSANVLVAYDGPATQRAPTMNLPAPLVPVDYGYVTLNYDKAWFAKTKLPLPQSLEQLAQPEYAKLLVVQNPSTSSTGLAFLLGTIGLLGEKNAFDWWARMRAGGMKVAKGWSEAYYTEFSRNAGMYPLVVSYASSPAAEVFYGKDKLSTPPTGSLALPGAVFRQVEGVALVRGGGARAAAEKFIEFMRSAPVQQQMQTEMWMFPVEPGIPRVDAMRFALEPAASPAPSDADVATQTTAWVSRWIRTVLR